MCANPFCAEGDFHACSIEAVVADPVPRRVEIIFGAPGCLDGIEPWIFKIERAIWHSPSQQIRPTSWLSKIICGVIFREGLSNAMLQLSQAPARRR